jgi:hypothetical protein
MPSRKDLINSALLELGDTVIADLDESSTEATIARATFDEIRDELLDEHPWRFAQTRVALDELSPAPEFGYEHRYQLPNDHIRVSSVNDIEDDAWDVEGQELLTDAAPVEIVYTRRVEETGLYSPRFNATLIKRLAMHWSEPLTSSTSLSDRIEKKADRTERRAKSADGQEGSVKPMENYGWLEER